MTGLGWGPLECRISDKFTRPVLLSGSTRAAMPYFFEVLRGWRVMNVRNSAPQVLGLRFDAFSVHDFKLVLGRHSGRERPCRDAGCDSGDSQAKCHSAATSRAPAPMSCQAPT
jgi:hypothetical protein